LAITSLAAAALVGVTACGGGDDDSADDQVASLDDAVDTATDDTTAGTTDGTTDGTTARDAPDDVEEAVLAFAECMRDHGVDMPDPQVNGDGGVAIQVDGDNGVSEAEMEEAQQECEPLMANARGEVERDPEREAEMQAEMLEFAECMREHGIDMPDPQFDGDGRVTMRAGAGEDGEAGDEPDRDSDAFEAAAKVCNPDGTFGAAPGGGNREGPSMQSNEDG